MSFTPLEFADQVKPCQPDANALAVAMIEMIAADKELYEAISKIPSYTGHRSSADYVATEQEAWNRKAEAYLQAVRNAVKPNLLR